MAKYELAEEVRLKCAATAGDYKTWKKSAHGLFEIEPARHAQAGVLMGLSGAPCNLAQDAPISFSLEGPSTSGKSSAQGMAAGNWANPDIRNSATCPEMGRERADRFR
jgi:hypothetical protein